MYCPRCAVQNLDDAKFCRACGADIRLVPQALQGTLHAALDQPENDGTRRRRREKRHAPATVDAALGDIFKGIGLFIIFLTGLFVFRGAFWVTIWFIIPALASVGEGIGQLIRARQEAQAALAASPGAGASGAARVFSHAPYGRELSSPDTREIVRVPVSVTDVTTRHLDAPSKMH
ncbi:MAG TPA: zinc ribbon domain-containing protein [Pyrinomonadaceae bacterium]|nr:zinc ribbon domain-containing protein [Pyrinomonadaceae bacterium]